MTFHGELADLLSKYNKDSLADTRDDILATFFDEVVGVVGRLVRIRDRRLGQANAGEEGPENDAMVRCQAQTAAGTQCKTEAEVIRAFLAADGKVRRLCGHHHPIDVCTYYLRDEEYEPCLGDMEEMAGVIDALVNQVEGLAQIVIAREAALRRCLKVWSGYAELNEQSRTAARSAFIRCIEMVEALLEGKRVEALKEVTA